MADALSIHCMQGRLVPPEAGRFQTFPVHGWRREIELASAAGVDGIEWIYDEHGADANPLARDDGVAEMRRLCAAHDVRVESLCADWFIDSPLLHSERDERRARVRWVHTRARAAGIRRIVIPFVDASALQCADDVNALVEVLVELLPELGVELHLETDLAPDDFAALLSRVDHPLVKANYDTGNSASLGYDPRDEVGAYGARIGSVHVKDRIVGGGTVPLGTGSADLELVFALLQERGWSRPLVLQVARGEEGCEVETVRSAAGRVRELWAASRSRVWS